MPLGSRNYCSVRRSVLQNWILFIKHCQRIMSKKTCIECNDKSSTIEGTWTFHWCVCVNMAASFSCAAWTQINLLSTRLASKPRTIQSSLAAWNRFFSNMARVKVKHACGKFWWRLLLTTTQNVITLRIRDTVCTDLIWLCYAVTVLMHSTFFCVRNYPFHHYCTWCRHWQGKLQTILFITITITTIRFISEIEWVSSALCASTKYDMQSE